jgi:hypothetical protein
LRFRADRLLFGADGLLFGADRLLFWVSAYPTQNNTPNERSDVRLTRTQNNTAEPEFA